jgi:ADP-sugar diphosphatase
MSISGVERTLALTITDYQGQAIKPGIAVYLPHNLTAEEFWRLLPTSTSSRPAFTFSALNNWLSKLLKALKLQEDERHPFYKHPYKLLEIDVQAVDWFWRNREGCEDKLGFMKVQAKVETDPYEHGRSDRKEAKPDWIPGAVFLRGGSVAILVRHTGRLVTVYAYSQV